MPLIVAVAFLKADVFRQSVKHGRFNATQLFLTNDEAERQAACVAPGRKSRHFSGAGGLFRLREY